MLPAALQKTGCFVFTNCPKIRVIWIDNSSLVDRLRRECKNFAILQTRSTMVGNKFLWDLRRLKDIVIPDGAQEIGEYWFKSVEAKSVTIPASVTVIGKRAFCGCKQLKCVTFVKSNRTEKT